MKPWKQCAPLLELLEKKVKEKKVSSAIAHPKKKKINKRLGMEMMIDAALRGDVPEIRRLHQEGISVTQYSEVITLKDAYMYRS